MIAASKTFSDDYGINIDIYESDHFISVLLHIDCGAFPKMMTKELAYLLTMCDSVSFTRPVNEPTDFTIDLKFRTHDHYVLGKLADDD